MKILSVHHVRNMLAVAIISSLAYGVYVANPASFGAPKVEAGTVNENVSGWAWSDTIGWISFNNTTDGSTPVYGVKVSVANKGNTAPAATTGDFSGTAWSTASSTVYASGIGWISFDRSRTGTPPAAPFNGVSGPIAQVDWATGKVTGWARALSACTKDASGNLSPTPCVTDPNAGGWDGWIKLSDDNVSVWKGKGVKITGNKFSGYAWGGAQTTGPSGDSAPGGVSVIGWIDFAPKVGNVSVGVQVAAPPCAATDKTVAWGTCTPLTQCSAQGTSDVPGIQVGVCTSGGTVTRSCTVSQTCAAQSTSPSGSKTKFWQF